ncbi:MAG: hypothetical protein JNK57_19935, partial [Planctomycetaceae bacterium]|nr:hypothetical protein [Planctomycetaceae bacterium]
MAWNHPALLKIGPRVSVFPVVHGSGDFAWEVRRLMLQGDFDALAIPLPASLQKPVEQAVLNLPTPAVVIQPFHEYQPVWDEQEHAHEHDHGPEATETWKNDAEPGYESPESEFPT